MWRLMSSESGIASSGGSSSSNGDGGGEDATPAWVWVDVGIAWAIAPAAGGSLQLSLWASIVPSWLCVTLALAFGLRAEEVRLGGMSARWSTRVARPIPAQKIWCPSSDFMTL